MRQVIFILLLSVLGISPVYAVGGNAKLDAVEIDLSDQASLQRGARTFVNYCLSCHSAQFMRYNRMGNDLGISEDLVKQNLMIASKKVGDLMTVSMTQDDGKAWFGKSPPDLSVGSRSRSPEWLYTYLRSFFWDDEKGRWDNVIFPSVAMPHVLSEMQGRLRPVFRVQKDIVNGKEQERKVLDKLERESPGTLSKDEFDMVVKDLTNFMVYLGEPAKMVRTKVGIYVLLFLTVLLVLTFLLKKEYWKDVH